MKLVKPALLSALLLFVGITAQAQDTEFNLDETYQIDESGTVYLDSDDAEVTIEASDRSDVHVVIYHSVDVDGWELKSGEEFKMDVETRAGNLYVKEANSGGNRLLFGNVEEEYRITLEVPKTVALDIKGDDGTYDITDIGAALRIDADDTEVEIRGATGNSFEFNIDDGSVEMDRGQGELTMDMDDGEFRVRQASFREIDGDFDDGEMDITTSLADDGFYLFDMDDGELELNISGGGGEFDINHDDGDIRVGSSFEEIMKEEEHSLYRLPGGDATIEIDSDDGDIDLRTI